MDTAKALIFSRLLMENPDLNRLINAIKDCALIMLKNAIYIQGELPKVEMPEAIREQTKEICESMAGTKYEVVSELFIIHELLKSEADQADVSSRIFKLIRWLWEDILKMHHVVLALQEESRKNENYTLSLILVQESAANIINAFNRAKNEADSLAGENTEKGNT